MWHLFVLRGQKSNWLLNPLPLSVSLSYTTHARLGIEYLFCLTSPYHWQDSYCCDSHSRVLLDRQVRPGQLMTWRGADGLNSLLKSSPITRCKTKHSSVAQAHSISIHVVLVLKSHSNQIGLKTSLSTLLHYLSTCNLSAPTLHVTSPLLLYLCVHTARSEINAIL